MRLRGKERQIEKKMADAADGEDEFEAVDQRLSESQKCSLYKDLEGYRSLWDTSYVPLKNKHQNKLQKEKGLEELSQKHNLSPGYLKRQIHAARTSLAREIKKQSDDQKSKWKFFDTLNYMKEDVLRSLKAKEESEWTENETEQLIEYYKQNDILWNHSLSSYKDRNLKELSYTKLSELLPGRSHEICCETSWSFGGNTSNKTKICCRK